MNPSYKASRISKYRDVKRHIETYRDIKQTSGSQGPGGEQNGKKLLNGDRFQKKPGVVEMS